MDTQENSFKYGTACDLINVSPDIKRMLKVQFKEFINTIDDYELARNTVLLEGNVYDFNLWLKKRAA